MDTLVSLSDHTETRPTAGIRPALAAAEAGEEQKAPGVPSSPQFDRAVADARNPGRRPAPHRLSRTEYQNEVSDLLPLDNLPKEFDVSTLPPAGNVTSGIDNIAELLFVCPSTLERYLAAVRKISRLAVGDASMPPIVDRDQLDRDQIQESHTEGLLLGTRGGTMIHSHLPANGEYVLTVEFAQAAREDQDLDLLLPFYAEGRAQGGFNRGIQRTLERLLVSPEFLFRIERDPADVGPRLPYPVGDLELAASLSFFLLSSISNDELLERAIHGTLGDVPVIEAQVATRRSRSRRSADGNVDATIVEAESTTNDSCQPPFVDYRDGPAVAGGGTGGWTSREAGPSL